MNQAATTSPDSPADTKGKPLCPICETHEVSEAWRLYDFRVCRKCAVEFTRRRRAALLLDFFSLGCLLSLFFWGISSVSKSWITIAPVKDIIGICLFSFFFMLRDSWSGISPGKWLMGVQAVDIETREPIGLMASFKRNLPLSIPYIGFLFIVISLVRMENGPRIGDGWAKTMVIWRKYARTLPFEGNGVYCSNCFYNLTGNVSGICPECGTPVPERTKEILAGVETPVGNP